MNATPINIIPGLTNYEVPVPGTNVLAGLGVWDSEPCTWLYSLWVVEGDEETLISSESLTLPVEALGKVTPEQVARIAFLLDVEYAS